jgi:hypothetical protein
MADFTDQAIRADTSGMRFVLDLLLAISFFGIPGAVLGFLAARREGRAPAAVTTLLVGAAMAVVAVGRSSAAGDPFGTPAILILLALVTLNACTAIGGVALARHARHRDAHFH